MTVTSSCCWPYCTVCYFRFPPSISSIGLSREKEGWQGCERYKRKTQLSTNVILDRRSTIHQQSIQRTNSNVQGHKDKRHQSITELPQSAYSKGSMLNVVRVRRDPPKLGCDVRLQLPFHKLSSQSRRVDFKQRTGSSILQIDWEGFRSCDSDYLNIF
jgi:hypothetical protein